MSTKLRFIIRPATLFDAAEIARINVQTWQHTYRGLIEQRMLDSLSEAKRREFWYTAIQKLTADKSIVVAEVQDERYPAGLAAYISSGLSRESGFEGEVYALYADVRHQRSGVGTALLQEAFTFARSRQWKDLCVRVLSANPYKDFYLKHGARFAHTVKERIGEREYDEEILVWTIENT